VSKPSSPTLALITGASRGLGRALALELAKTGAHIIAVARTVGALEELDDDIKAVGGSATLVPLNVTDFDALDRLGASIHERWGKLDICIGNAGWLGPISPIHHVDSKSWDQVIATNVTANWRLIRAMDPLLRAAPHGRAVFITSNAAQSCKAYWGPYSVSKAALEALVKTYAHETLTTPIRAMLVNPGPMRTAMRRAAYPGEDAETLPLPEEIVRHILPLLTPQWEQTGEVLNLTSSHALKGEDVS
jgi:NAD(P)-dependent dehydrogenase (short-subunit alcohol dehydrogenase family)